MKKAQPQVTTGSTTSTTRVNWGRPFRGKGQMLRVTFFVSVPKRYARYAALYALDECVNTVEARYGPLRFEGGTVVYCDSGGEPIKSCARRAARRAQP